MSKALHQKLAAWIYGSVLVALLVGLLLFGPDELPTHKQRILAFVSSVLVAPFGYLIVGTIAAEKKGADGGWLGGFAVKASGGFALFVISLLWWNSAAAPVRASKYVLDLAEVVAVVEQKYEMLDDQSKDHLLAGVRAALERAYIDAQEGTLEAQAALDAARQSGDLAEVQSLLVADAVRLKSESIRTRTDYLERCREVAAVAYLRGDNIVAEVWSEEILRESPDDWRARDILGQLAGREGRWDDAVANYERLLNSSDRHAQVRASSRLGVIHARRGVLDQAQVMFQKAIELAEQLGDFRELARGYGNLGVVFRVNGDLDEAERMSKKSLEIHEEWGWLEGAARNYDNLAMIYFVRGDLDQAESLNQKALELNERLGSLEGIATCYGNLGSVFRVRGDWDKAKEAYLKSLEMSERLNAPEMIAANYGNLGTVCQGIAAEALDQGIESRAVNEHLEEAVRMHEKSRQINDRIGAIEALAANYGNLGHIQLLLGHLDEAESLLRKSAELNERVGTLHAAAASYGNIGLVFQERGDFKEALHWLRKAEQVFEQLGAKIELEQIGGMIRELEARLDTDEGEE